MTNPENIRYCPKCEKEINPSCAPIFDFIGMGISAARYDALYFLCGECRVACIDKSVIRRGVSIYRNSLNKKSKKELPHKEMYKKVLETLENILEDHCVKHLGYKRIARLNKTPRK